MPNVQIIGFDDGRAKTLRDQIEVVLRDLKLGSDAITTIVPAEAASADGDRVPSPYLRVCSTSRAEINRIIIGMRAKDLGVDVELIVLAGFVPADKLMTVKTRAKRRPISRR